LRLLNVRRGGYVRQESAESLPTLTASGTDIRISKKSAEILSQAAIDSVLKRKGKDAGYSFGGHASAIGTDTCCPGNTLAWRRRSLSFNLRLRESGGREEQSRRYEGQPERSETQREPQDRPPGRGSPSDRKPRKNILIPAEDVRQEIMLLGFCHASSALVDTLTALRKRVPEPASSR
jgi:hypothetical protein